MIVSMGNDTMFNQTAEINLGRTDEMVVTIIFRNSAAKVHRLNYFITIIETSMRLYIKHPRMALLA
jgi:hypothetical protein